MNPADLTLPAGVPGRPWTDMYADHAGTAARAVVSKDGAWTFSELTAQGGAWAAWLDVVGAPASKPVPIMVGANPAAYGLMVAGAFTDRPMAPLGDRHTASELATCVAALGSELLVVDADAEPLAKEVSARVGARVVVLPPTPPSTAAPLVLEAPRDRVVLVLHTSGTTGQPRAVRFTNDRLGARARVYADLLGLGPGDVYSSSQQFHHLAGAGLLAVALSVGVTVVPPTSRFSIDGWRRLADLGTTHATVAPTMIERLLRARALDFPSLRMIVYGASPIRYPTARKLLARHPDLGVFQGYSQTEGGPITALGPDDHRAAVAERPEWLHSVGRPVPGCEVRILEPDADGVGEVLARADHLAAPGADGWLHTGDLGWLSDDGFLFLAGRKGDLIIRGGENVYPEEVEARLEEHPWVREAAVVGLPHDDLGEEVAAFVVPSGGGAALDPEELRAFVRTELSGFKVPTTWHVVDELPRGPLGKLQRRLLREVPR